MSASSAIGPTWDYSVTKGCKWSESGMWEVDGTPVDLTDATFTVVVKTAEDSSGVSAGTIASSVLVAAEGRLSWGQSVAQVNAMEVGSYWWSATLALDGEEPQHLWQGKFDVRDVAVV